MSRFVVALGGNALLRSGEGSVAEQRARIAETRDALEPLHERGHDLVFTHGNGPQVGNRLLAEEESEGDAEPLDVLVAETQAQVGYLLQSGFGDAFGGPPAPVVTRVRVDPDDPGFDDPAKPVGPYYTASEAAEKPFETTAIHGGGGDGTRYRRVVASPDPVEILEADHLAALVENGAGPVVCGGGGGVPVVPSDDAGSTPGDYEGVPGVVDKDHTTRLVADVVDAETVVMLTDVDAVYRNYDTDDPTPIRETTPSELRALREADEFPAGSMRPKVSACARFVDETGGRAIVTDPESLVAALDGDAGTTVRPA
ncbi:carbamate kinase [Halarchaeum solikamskense]|uniref:amino acid kinase family protein n=1 Tax=Halarchaeum nitratireducens TaxID=489913 RepID=UPI001B3AFDBF|nr:carbamate kinase [Halarchaeum solikamskense]MBP2250034.1 carbamate kinase [Halarchaeum solikamskense]